MITKHSPYSLGPVELENAVQALQKAAERLRPSPSEERLYRYLGICIRVAGAGFVGTMLTLVVLFVVSTRKGMAPTDAFFIVTGLFVLLFVAAVIAALVFLLLNQAVIIQSFRQRRLLKRLGIREASLSAWRRQRRGHLWSRLVGAVLTGCSIISLVIGAFAALGTWTSDKEEDAWSGAIGIGLCFVFGVTVLVWRFVQRSREQWAIVGDANSLRSTLESFQTKAGAGEAVAVPAAVVERAGQIERVSIARERHDAVLASAGTTNHGYGVLVARDLSSQRGSLDPQQRVAVEGLIENLSANPHPPGVESTPDGLLSVRTTKGDVELKYSIDDAAQRVHIVALTAHDHD